MMSVKDLIGAAETNDVIAFRRAFDDEMMSKIADAIDVRKLEVTSKIFGNTQQEVDDFEDETEVQDGDSYEED